MKNTKLWFLFALCLLMSISAEAKKKKDVCIQLYSVRDVIKNGTEMNQILTDLSKMGYTSVEAANYNDGKFYGMTPEEFKQMVEKSGMKVLSSHCGKGLTPEE